MTGTVLIEICEAYVLFDSGSTHSFVSPRLAGSLGVESRKMDIPLAVSSPLGRSWVTDVYHLACGVVIEGHRLSANLILLEMLDFDVILGMD